MSLSTGPNSKKLSFDFQSQVARMQVNQLRGIQPNSGVGSGIPQQVTGVTAQVATAATGLTSTVKVIFSRNSADPNFQLANVYVKGYNGSQAPVLMVSAADSPATIVLNNTGENILVIVQAAGNSGAAPLSQSPTTGVKLPLSTAGGFSTSTQTSAAAPSYTGDLSVAGSVATVVGIESKAISSAVFADEQILEYNATTSKWVPKYYGAYHAGFNVNGAGTGIDLFGTDAFTLASSGGAGNTRVAPTATDPVGCNLPTSTTNPATALIALSAAPATNAQFTNGILKQLHFRMALVQTTAMRVWIGLGDTITAATYDAAAPAANIMGFRFSTFDSDTKFQLVTQTSAVAQSILASSQAPDTNPHNFLITYDGTTVSFYYDGTLLGTRTANIPANTVGLGPFIAFATHGTAGSIRLYSMRLSLGNR